MILTSELAAAMQRVSRLRKTIMRDVAAGRFSEAAAVAREMADELDLVAFGARAIAKSPLDRRDGQQ